MFALTLLRQLLGTGLALWALVSAIFLLSHRDPTGPETWLLPDLAERAGPLRTARAEQEVARQAVRERLGLNLPLFYTGRVAQPTGRSRWRWIGSHNQYHQWLMTLVQGDLGRSIRTGEPVGARLAGALRYTLPLMSLALLVAATAALGLGVRLAATPRWWHPPVRTLLVAVQSIPLLLLALALLRLLALFDEGDGYALGWNWVFSFGLPLVSLVLVALPELTLQLEAGLRLQLQTGYAATARAKGVGEEALLWHHALPNALAPSISQLTEMLPALVSGALVVEVVYGLPGVGRLLAEAAALRDYPVLIAGVLLAGAARLGALLLADGLYRWADPRLRWHRATA